MRLPVSVIFVLFALLTLALLVAPGAVLGLVFVVVLWKMWQHRGQGVRR